MKTLAILVLLTFFGIGATAQVTTKTAKASTTKVAATKTYKSKTTTASTKTANADKQEKPINLSAMLIKLDSTKASKPDSIEVPRQF